jgi:hypothetical protein
MEEPNRSVFPLLSGWPCWLVPGAMLAFTLSCTSQPAAPDAGSPPDMSVPLDLAQPKGGSCAHALCTSGGKLLASCDPCVQKICEADSYCCSIRWSSQCVREVGTLCDTPCSGSADMSSGSTDMSSGGGDLAGPTSDLGSGSPDLSGPSPDFGGGGGDGGTGIGPGGGTVDHLFFAVVGDTRPSKLDDTANYPSAIIQKIYSDIQGMSPRPQFVVGTGDYMFANVTGSEGAAQLSLYAAAMRAYSGTVFAAMGNHECDGYTADNCAGMTTNNLSAYMNTLVKPLGKSLHYYTVPISAIDGSWTAKLVIVGCNNWDSTQKAWLQAELAKPTTYTFVVRHEPASETRGPCVTDVESLLASYPYNLSLVGHTHHYALSGKEVIVGNGGAPLSGGTYGYTTVEQLSSGFRVSNYDYATAGAVSTATVPF